jgi:hypothetical protein
MLLKEKMLIQNCFYDNYSFLNILYHILMRNNFINFKMYNIVEKRYQKIKQ